MNKEILSIVKLLSKKRSIDKEKIFIVLENALELATKKKYNININIRISIDRKNGDFHTFRRWLVVRTVSVPTKEITLEAAKLENKNVKLNDYIESVIDSVVFDRITTNTIKKIILKKVKEIKFYNILDQFYPKKGKIIIGIITKITWDRVFLNVEKCTEGIITRKNMLPRENFRIGDYVRGVLYKISSKKKCVKLFLSRSSSKMIIELFRIEVPEIVNKLIEIKAVARDSGLRSKLAVKSNDARIDPIGACIGMRGSRVQAVSNELYGERIDVILWDEDPKEFILNAMAPAIVTSIFFNKKKNIFDIIVKTENFAQAIGRNGQNVRLASQITGLKLNIIKLEVLNKKRNLEKHKTFKIFKKYLHISDKLIFIFMKFGFFSLESIFKASISHLENILGLSKKKILNIQYIAKKNYYVTSLNPIIYKKKNNVSYDLLKLKGWDEKIIKKLIYKKIFTLEKLAEQNIEDLIDIPELDINKARNIIMLARNLCWFQKNNILN